MSVPVNRKRNIFKKDIKENKPKGFVSKLIFSDTVIIGLITLLAYLSVYGYGLGYCAYFKIPLDIIEFSFSKFIILVKDAVFIPFLLWPVMLSLYGTYLFSSEKRTISRAVLTILLCMSPSLYIFPIAIMYKPIVIIVFLILLVVYYVPLFYFWFWHSDMLSLKSKIEMIFADEKMGRFLSIGVIIAYGLVVGFNLIGFGNLKAKISTVFLVANTTPECAVLYYINQDTIICSPFNRNSKELEPVFKFIKISESEDIEFRRESIGPLHQKRTPTPTPRPTLTPKDTNTPVPTITASPTP